MESCRRIRKILQTGKTKIIVMKGSSSSGSVPGADGLLLIDKPSGYTSHDVVARMRRHLGMRKIGHGGTLDPMATGLLVLLLGRGTKLSNLVMGSDKLYEGTIQLGVSTDSQDAEGEVISESDASGVTAEQIDNEFRIRTGDLMQTPPMVSAIKKDGVPLYKHARKGKSVKREPRLIHIYSFRRLRFDAPMIDFQIRCTKGTYVRTLASDIGDALECGAHLCALRRIESGSLHLDDAMTLEQALETRAEELLRRVIPPHRVRAAIGENA